MSRDQGTVHKCQHGQLQSLQAEQLKVPRVSEEIWKKVPEETKNSITCRRGIKTDILGLKLSSLVCHPTKHEGQTNPQDED